MSELTKETILVVDTMEENDKKVKVKDITDLAGEGNIYINLAEEYSNVYSWALDFMNYFVSVAVERDGKPTVVLDDSDITQEAYDEFVELSERIWAAKGNVFVSAGSNAYTLITTKSKPSSNSHPVWFNVQLTISVDLTVVIDAVLWFEVMMMNDVPRIEMEGTGTAAAVSSNSEVQ